MELILAVFFTVLAGAIGALLLARRFSKKAQQQVNCDLQKGVDSTETKEKKGKYDTSTPNKDDELKTLPRNGHSQDHNCDDIDSDMIINPDDLQDCKSPLEEREYLRYLRKSEIKKMTEEEREEEERIQREQLSNIFLLMQKNQEQLGINSMEEMEEQMKLYSQF